MSPSEDPTVADQILTELRRQRWALIVMAFVIMGAGITGYVILSNRGDQNARTARSAAVLARESARLSAETSRLAKNARTDHAALCTFKTDLQKRVTQSRDFLAKHPNGIPGIPASVIVQGLRNQQATVDSLENLNCPDKP